MKQQSESVNKGALVNDKLKSHHKKFKDLMLLIGLSVLTIVTPVKAATGDNAKEIPTVSAENEKDIHTKQIEASKEFLTFIGNLAGKEPHVIQLSKADLNTYYAQFLKVRSVLGPELEKYARNFLLDSFLTMLKEKNGGYNVKGATQLDPLPEIIELLSNNTLDVTISPDIPAELKDEIKVVIEKDPKNPNSFIIKENKGIKFFSNNSGIIEIPINIVNLIKPFKEDSPASSEESEAKINRIHQDNLRQGAELCAANIKIGKLEYELAEAKKTIGNLEKKVLDDAEKARNDAEIARTNALQHLKDELDKLQKQFDIEKAKLNQDIVDRDTKYTELSKQFEAAKNKATADAEIAKNNALQHLGEELAKQKNQFDTEKAKLTLDIGKLRQFIENNDNLYTQEKKSYTDRIEDLQKQVIALSNENTSLKATNEKSGTSKIDNGASKEGELSALRQQLEAEKKKAEALQNQLAEQEKGKNVGGTNDSKRIAELVGQISGLKQQHTSEIDGLKKKHLKELEDQKKKLLLN